MAGSYLTTDIVVIIVLFIVLVLVGLGAFFIHYYWTKIGVAEIWNTTTWSSMRSSVFRTVRRLTQRKGDKLVSEPPLTDPSVYSDDIDDVSVDKYISNPRITSYITPSNSIEQKPVSIIPSNQPVRTNYGTKIGQPMENTKIYNVYENKKNQSNDLASMIQKQRF